MHTAKEMSKSVEESQLVEHGWTAVPRSFARSLASINNDQHARLKVADMQLPNSDLAKKTYEFAKKELPEETFNHSMRVWCYGFAIIQTHLPHLSPMLETYFLLCLLHDIGTTSRNMNGTHMSFEYYGAFQALNFLQNNGAAKDQAEAISEAIIRHADLGEIGTLTSLGLLIQLSTVFDNVGLNPHLIDTSTIESVVSVFPRKRWTSCFATAMQEEMRLKPWCHTTANEGFVEAVLGNKLMESYDD